MKNPQDSFSGSPNVRLRIKVGSAEFEVEGPHMIASAEALDWFWKLKKEGFFHGDETEKSSEDGEL